MRLWALLLLAAIAMPLQCATFWDYTDNHTFSCQQADSLTSDQLWYRLP